jgi:hypothetical protein
MTPPHNSIPESHASNTSHTSKFPRHPSTYLSMIDGGKTADLILELAVCFSSYDIE